VPGATGYRVYRSSSSSGTYSSTGEVYEVYTTSYTDTGLSPNTTYYYKVSAYSYREGARSNAVSATTQQSGGSDPTAPSFGTPLTEGQAAQNSIATIPQHYYFFATSGRSYTIFWYDYDSSNSGGDVRVSAYWDSDGAPILASNDIGYNGIPFIAGRTGYVMLEVTQVGARSGSYQILYR
jgi:hypothetical protein